MGNNYGGAAPNLTSYTNNLGGLYQAQVPQDLTALNSAQNNTDIQNIGQSQALTNAYSQMGLGNLLNYGSLYAGVGNQIQNQNALSGAQTNLQQILGPGGMTALAANQLEQAVNPQYYMLRDTNANQAANLVNSINLNGLSGGEQAAVERSLGGSNYARGTLGLDNATTAVGNAMNFGDYLNTKRTALGQALGASTGVMAGVNNTAWNPVSTALSQPDASTQSNWGTSQFGGTTKATGVNANTLSSDYLSALTGMSNTQMGTQWSSNAASSASQIEQDFGLGSLNCCFIMLESYHGKLPWWVRECRDSHYDWAPQIARGYKRMAKWLVPMMRRVPLVKNLVWELMVLPITRFGGYLCDIPEYKQYWSARPIRNFWFHVWGWMGRDSKHQH